MLVVFSVLASAPGAGAQQVPEGASSDGVPDHARAEGYRDLRSEQSSHDEYDELAERAGRDGTVRAIVGLRVAFTPEGSLSAPRAGAQRADIARQRRAVQDDLRDTGARTTAELQTVPYLGVELPERGVEALRRSPHVASVDLDEALPPALAQSTPLVQGSAMHTAGYTGAGKVVAILDTGVDKAHPFFGGRVVEEACYSSNTTWSTSVCPGQASESTAPGSGVHCTGVAGCGHGTHVAGIAAGSGGSSVGVAPAAGIMAVQVFSRFDSADECGNAQAPCLMSWSSDQMRGLERVYALRATHDMAAANLSLGGAMRTAPCDTDPLKTIIDTLNSVGTATVLAAGNNSWSDAVTAPACISTAVTVGSTTKTDGVSSFTNSHPTMIDLYAPGSAITSAVPGGGFASWSGTSMAAPQVAGAWAVLRQARPTATVPELVADLRSTGILVTDTRPADPALHHAHPRILVDDARNATAAIPAPEGLTFVPVAPCAVFDTRNGQDGFGGKLAGGEKRTFQVTGAIPVVVQGGQACSAPPAGAVAVELNLVAVEAEAPGNLQIAAAGVSPRGGVVNFVAGVSNSNALPVEVSTAGAVDVVNNAGGGDVHVRGVVLGYYTDVEAAGLEFVPMAPCAVFDTRSGGGTFAGKLAGGESRTFRVTGLVPADQGGQVCPAPPAGAVAVKLNLVAVEAAGSGNLQIAAAGVAPQGGVVNFAAGAANSNALPVEVSSTGAVDVVNNTGGGDVHVRGVVLGYYAEGDAAGLKFVPVAPCAVFDTRSGAGGLAGRLGGGLLRTFQVTGVVPAGQGGQSCPAPPADAVAVELNLVAVEAAGSGNLLIAAAGVVPQGGVVNFTTGVANSNALPVKVSTAGAVDVTNNAGGGDVHVRGVALGYYVVTAP